MKNNPTIWPPKCCIKSCKWESYSNTVRRLMFTNGVRTASFSPRSTWTRVTLRRLSIVIWRASKWFFRSARSSPMKGLKAIYTSLEPRSTWTWERTTRKSWCSLCRISRRTRKSFQRWSTLRPSSSRRFLIFWLSGQQLKTSGQLLTLSRFLSRQSSTLKRWSCIINNCSKWHRWD